MTTLRITAHMLQPVAFDPAEGLSIDSPLLFAVKLEQRAADTMEPDPRMPLAVHRAGGTWCYAASLAELHWNKRLDEAAALRLLERRGLELGKRRKIPTNSGEFKSYHMPLWLEVVERLVWYAVGDRDEVLRLLTTHVRGVGKKRNSGHGAVAAWEVEEVDVPPERWLWREPGVPARAIPTRMLDGWTGETAWLGFRPPYWLAANQTWCATRAPIRVEV